MFFRFALSSFRSCHVLLACVLAAQGAACLAHETGAAHAHTGAQPGVVAQEVQIRNAWVRATVAGQMATGAFMELHAAQDLQLVAARSPLTPVVEVHEMALANGVMKMRQLKALPLPAGHTAVLKPGGNHIMLMNLKAPLTAGSSVPLTLVFKDAQGRTLERSVQAPVRSAATAPASNHHGMPAPAGAMMH